MRRFAGRAATRWLGSGLIVGVLGATGCSDDTPHSSAHSAGAAGTPSSGNGGGHPTVGGSSSGHAGEPGNAGQGTNVDAGAGGGSDATPTAAHDLVIYGCTSAGVIAAVQAKQMKKSVILVCPETYLGGLTTQGLGWTDTGDNSVIGGLSRDFYARIKQAYDDDARWKQQTKASYSHYDLSLIHI